MRQARIAVGRPAALLMIAAAAILFSLFAAPPDLVPAQVVVENPAKPLARDAGHVLALTEVWRISFYYFTPGPDLFIRDMNYGRLWRTDLDGVFQEQINLVDKDYRGLLGIIPDGLLFLKSVMPPPEERTGKLMEILRTVVLVAMDGLKQKDIATFRPKEFLALQAGMSWDPSIIKTSPDGKLLYAVHSRDYLIEVADVSSGTTIRSYRRQYRKVPYAEKGWEPDFRKKYGAPKMEYEIDISDIFPSGDRLWVETSTDDKAKGRLIDVFDKDGRFVDSFYLGPGRRLLGVTDDHIFCQEKKEDESIALVKYRIDK